MSDGGPHPRKCVQSILPVGEPHSGRIIQCVLVSVLVIFLNLDKNLLILVRIRRGHPVGALVVSSRELYILIEKPFIEQLRSEEGRWHRATLNVSILHAQPSPR